MYKMAKKLPSKTGREWDTMIVTKNRDPRGKRERRTGMEFEDTLDMSAEQEGVVGSPSGADGTEAEEGGNEQPAAGAAETGETGREEDINRRIAAARRKERRRAGEEYDAQIAAKGYAGADGKAITNRAQMFAYLDAIMESQLRSEAETSKRPVEELRRERAERAAGRAAMSESEKERNAQEFMTRDIAEFAEAYPKVNVKNLLSSGSRFLKFAGSRLGKESMTELYEDYLDFATDKEGEKKAESKAKRATGSGSGDGAAGSLTAAQRAKLDEWNRTYPGMKMTEKEFLERG